MVQEGADCLAKIDNREGDGKWDLSLQVFLFIQFSLLWSSTPGDEFWTGEQSSEVKLKSLQCSNVVTSEISYGFTGFHIFIAYPVTLYIFCEMGKSKGYWFFW